MKIVMISNYINHHQIPFAEALLKIPGVEYYFIQTEPMDEERVKMGWETDVKKLPYVQLLYEDETVSRALIADCDLLLAGWMNREDLIEERLKSGKLTVRMSERLYREGQYKMISPRGLIRKYKEHTRYRNQNVFLLCLGAYVSSDFHLIRAYPQKMFQFGYFTELRTYRENELCKMKPDVSELQFIWAGRFIPLKHPEFALQLAADLKKAGISFHLHMVGDGEMKEELLDYQKENSLQEEVSFYGFMNPEQVRDKMEQCHIHLFTSNYLEGWGAVVNESMNSGCVPVVNDEIGCAPFLIQNGKNGLLYHGGEYEDLKKQVFTLVSDREQIQKMGLAAYEQIATVWNAENAAKQLLRFYDNFQKGKIDPPAEGPFSVAEILKAPKRLDQKNARKL